MELLQIATASVITKCDGQLLQIATLSCFITKCETAQVLQIATGITKCDGFITKCDGSYKLNCDRTTSAYTEFMSEEGFC